ncbi:alpha/beta hydrolase [Yinghuangia soli]|uniref:Acyl-CoA:diacylglycerol acyltransferase n=1 Tax=Yinghuangia soli TaxID=2908204 RepID=A0AA41U0Q0_9ACTN|nr:alpha/beta hydrolase family protein [Yinghuangia soli]MCF2528690.1 esterase family protein [Yinghuangia soli]
MPLFATRRRPLLRLGTGAAAFVLAAVGLALPQQAAATQPAPPSLPNADSYGIDFQSITPVTGTHNPTSAPLYDVKLTTAAIYKQVDPAKPTVQPLRPVITVRILLPQGYQTNPANAYQSLYLLHGGTGDFDDWSRVDEGDIVQLAAQASYNGIVVMPEGGSAGWYSNWQTGTKGNIAPQWETFHIQQLVPWIDANFNTLKTKQGRMIAGLSMGGYGALRYAGRFPELFGAAAGFSPGTNIEMPWAQTLIHASVVAPTSPGASIGDPANIPDLDPYRYPLGWLWGPHQVFGPNGPNWDAQNPVKLATAGKYQTYPHKLALYAGTDEADIHGSVVDMHNNLKAVEGPVAKHRFCAGPGNHSWPYWRNGLTDFLRYARGETPASCTANTGWSLQS